jgi:hypothetical protein
LFDGAGHGTIFAVTGSSPPPAPAYAERESR